MTRYDPFSYGQVKLGDKGKPADSPDDLLFADTGPKAAAAPAADESWALLNENVDSLLPGADLANAGAVEFGSEILGEAPPPPASPPAPAKPRPAVAAAAPAKKTAEAARTTLGPARADAPREVRAKEAPKPAPVGKAATPLPGPAAAPRGAGMPLRRGRPLASIAVPFVLSAVGGTAASWFAIGVQNPVMAGIVGLLTAVGAAFAWLSLRP